MWRRGVRWERVRGIAMRTIIGFAIGRIKIISGLRGAEMDRLSGRRIKRGRWTGTNGLNERWIGGRGKGMTERRETERRKDVETDIVGEEETEVIHRIISSEMRHSVSLCQYEMHCYSII